MNLKKQIRFMRLIIFFDVPMVTKGDLKDYRLLIKYLKEEGYIRIQFSMYCKLCINAIAANTFSRRLLKNMPIKGDIRYLILSENQYQSIKTISTKFSLTEKITNRNRMLVIGGRNETNQ